MPLRSHVLAWAACDCQRGVGTVRVAGQYHLPQTQGWLGTRGGSQQPAVETSMTDRPLHWNIIGPDPDNPDRMLCKCSCGVERSVNSASLANGQSRSCGCKGWEKTRTVGRKFGLWEIIGLPDDPKKATCKCSCGTIKDVLVNNLSCGRTKSCGCRSKLGLNAKKFRKPKKSPIEIVWISGIGLSVDEWALGSGLPAATIRARLDNGMHPRDAVGPIPEF